MTDRPAPDLVTSWTDADQWPCGLVVIDGAGLIRHCNATLRNWLGLGATPPDNLRFIDILSRGAQIYFETHLRPMLVRNGRFAEVSLDLVRQDGTRCSVFINGQATLVDGVVVKAHFSLFQNDQRKSFERDLVTKRRESDEFRSLVQSSPHAIVYLDLSVVVRAWNAAAVQLFGYTAHEAIGQRFDPLLIPPADLSKIDPGRLRVAQGHSLRDETTRRHKDGRLINVDRSVAAIHDEFGAVTGYVAIYSDISKRKEAEAEVQHLLLEINHRAKNLLSLVQVIARQTGRRHDGPDFHRVFSTRLASLVTNQDLLIHGTGRHADLEALARAQFAHLTDAASTEVTIHGPAVALNARVSQALGMALFELVTNAAKYGALSETSGAVRVSWVVTDDAMLELTWQETAGPPVTEPTRTGFGYQVTGPILDSVTSGHTTRSYDPDGFRWSLTAPLDQVS